MNKIIFKISALLLLASCSEQCAPTANTSNSLAPVVANKKMPPPPPPFPLVGKLLEENKKDVIEEYLDLPGSDKIKVKHILNVKKDATPFLHVLIDEENDANIKEVLDILLPKANDAEIKSLLGNALDEKVASNNIAETLVQKGYKDSLNTLLKSPIPKEKLKVTDKEKFISLLDQDNAKDQDVIQNLFTNTAEALTFTDTIIASPNSSLEEKVSIINNLALADAANSADYDEKKAELADKIVADDTLSYEKRLELVDNTNLVNKNKQYAELADKIVADDTLSCEKRLELVDETKLANKDKQYTELADKIVADDTLSYEKRLELVDNTNLVNKNKQYAELADKIVADDTVSCEKRLELVDKTNLANKDKQYTKLADKIVADDTLSYEKRLELVDKTNLTNKDKPYEKISDNIFYDNTVSFTDKIDLINATKFSKDKDKDLYLESLTEQIVADDTLSYEKRLELVGKTDLANKDKQYTELADKIVADDKTDPQEKLALLTKIKNKVSKDSIKDIENKQNEIIDSPAIANDPTTFVKVIIDNFAADKINKESIINYYYEKHLSNKSDAEKPKAFADLKTAFSMNQHEWNNALTASDAIKKAYFKAGLINDKQSADTTGYKIDYSDFFASFLSLDDLNNLIANYKSMHIDKNDEDNDETIHQAFQTLLPDVIYDVLMIASENLDKPEEIKNLLQSLIDNCGGVDKFNKSTEGNRFKLTNVLFSVVEMNDSSFKLNNKFNKLAPILLNNKIELFDDTNNQEITDILSNLSNIKLDYDVDIKILSRTLDNLIKLSGDIVKFNEYLNNATKQNYEFDNYKLWTVKKSISLNPLAYLLANNSNSSQVDALAYTLLEKNIKVMEDSYYDSFIESIKNKDADNIEKGLLNLIYVLLADNNQKFNEVIKSKLPTYNLYSYYNYEPTYAYNFINFILAWPSKSVKDKFEYIKNWIDKGNIIYDNIKFKENTKLREKLSSKTYKEGYFKVIQKGSFGGYETYDDAEKFLGIHKTIVHDMNNNYKYDYDQKKYTYDELEKW